MNNIHLNPMVEASSIISAMSLEDLFNSSRSRFNGPMFKLSALSGNVDSNNPQMCTCQTCKGCITWKK